LNFFGSFSSAKIGSALRALSKTSERVQLRWQGNRVWYRQVDIDNLIDWSERHSIGDKDTMLRTLEYDVTGRRGENVVDMPGREEPPPDVPVGMDEEGNCEY